MPLAGPTALDLRIFQIIAVGMRGPIHALIQNVALMMLILDVTIAVAVALPYTLGKSLALNMVCFMRHPTAL